MDECNLCKESNLEVGNKGSYGAVVIYNENGWFATLSPKTGGDPEKDFSIQLMPKKHLKYFSEIYGEELSESYGIAFAKINDAVSKIIGDRDGKIPIGTYGKCKHPDEHIHFKVFPYRGLMGQPFTVDSSFGKKEIHKDDSGEFVKMSPIVKSKLSEERFRELSKKFIDLLK
jgi:diadenosine tetraphosphate (Ap4A) HIT family hydrolase